jgi:voltage-gated potassium channel
MRNYRRTWDNILILMALVFLIAFSWPAFDANLSLTAKQVLNVTQWVIWFFFAIDVIFGIIHAEDKKQYLKSHPLEVAAVILPFFRPLRLLRFVSLGALVIQKVSIGKSVGITLRLAIGSLFLTFLAAVQITQVERDAPGGNIETFGDAMWCALSTLVTDGYTDKYPVTTQGRLLAFGLMLLGITLLAAVSATMAAWFVRTMQKEDESKHV